MTHFMGTHHNRLDAKGRVSIPAPFRGALRDAAGEGETTPLVLRPSHRHPCIEGWPAAAFDRLAEKMDQLDVFSGEQEDETFVFYSDACPLTPDKEGRIVLPESLAAYAHLQEGVAFVGMRDYFQIWEPEAAKLRKDALLERTRAAATTGRRA